MRVRITFRVKNKGALVPFHHQYLLSQFFKGIILSDDQNKFDYYSDYNFSGIKGQTKVSKAGLHFNSNKVTVVFASESEEFMKFILHEIFSMKVIKIGNLQIEPEAADEELGIKLTSETKFVCISPVVVLPPSLKDNEGKRFISPDSDEFSDLLFDSTMNRLESSSLDTTRIKDIQKFQLVPDHKYLEKIRAMNKKFARIYPMYDQDVKHELRGYTFPFTLFAAPEVQSYLFTNGIGLFTSKGFGMLDLAHPGSQQNIVEYKELKNLIIA